jgi:phosphatidylglycerol:prolipoprotein diacylglycerol transferase
MINWLHNNLPEAILGTIGPLQIHWYGLLIALGIIAAYFLTQYLLRQYKFHGVNMDLLLLFVFLGGVIGGRLYYVLYAWKFYQNNLLDIFKVWEGGLALHGDLIGGSIGLALFAWHYKIKFLKLADLMVPGVALAQAIGRWGNYFNQELFGGPTSLPWGIPIKESLRPEQYLSATHFHPVFLYESIANILICLLLLALHRKNARRLPEAQFYMGFFLTLYIFVYSSVRFSLEFLRQDYSPYIGPFRWFQLMSLLAMMLSGAMLGYWAVKKIWKKK